PRDDGRAQRGRIVEIVDVIHAVGLEEPAEGSARNVAAVAEIEGAVETVVSREQVRAGAAKAGVVYSVCADIDIEAAVLIGLIAERRRAKCSFPGGVTLAPAPTNVKITALSGVDAAIPIGPPIDAAVLYFALFEAPGAAVDLGEGAWRRA